MESIAKRLQESLITGLIAGAICLLLVAALPFVGALALVLRPVLLALGLVLLLGSLAWPVVTGSSPQAVSTPRAERRGLRLPTDVLLHASHSWARFEAPGAAVVGADDLAQAALGPVEELKLPPRGLRVRRGDPLFRLSRAGRWLDLRSPVSGRVLEANEATRGRPGLVNDDPYGQGWVVRIESDDPQEDRRLLHVGADARTWFLAEAARLRSVVQSAGALLPWSNGALPVETLYADIDDAAWGRLTETSLASCEMRFEPSA